MCLCYPFFVSFWVPLKINLQGDVIDISNNHSKGLRNKINFTYCCELHFHKSSDVRQILVKFLVLTRIFRSFDHCHINRLTSILICVYIIIYNSQPRTFKLSNIFFTRSPVQHYWNWDSLITCDKLIHSQDVAKVKHLE